MALYHFDEGSGNTLTDFSGATGGPSPGDIEYGGNPAGPVVSNDNPFNCASLINSWVGLGIGEWRASMVNWSLGAIPGPCDLVSILTNASIIIIGTNKGLGKTLEVAIGSELQISFGAALEIRSP
ncbi:MAG: hypothetical protein IPL46_04260 [Saprospiraceae bacterium]|nr:hypothetical protein [Saprospiraceae bacterium]